MKKGMKKYETVFFCVMLVLVTVVAYEPVRRCGFTTYDDNEYVTANPNVSNGLKWESVVWAFTQPYVANWHPLTWLSHMVDCEVFGLKALWHHLVSVLLHIASTVLLFLVLRKMTSAVWESAFVAAAFALHPLHVESVAWVAERKDVLSGFFWMLTMAAYVRYAERPGVGRYIPVILFLCFGLLAKSMLVTLPCVLLLLDYWPLGRLRLGERETGLWRLIVEKVPLFIVVVVSSFATFVVQRAAEATESIEGLTFGLRVSNALVSYLRYLGKMFYPVNLAALYPFPTDGYAFWRPAVCLLLLIGVSVVLWRVRRRGYLVTGWFWYLGTLIPVIGLVQVGVQSMADRYTYLPSIGIFIMIGWGVAEISARWRYQKFVLGSLGTVAIVVMVICTRMQVRHWENDLTVFSRAVDVTENNYTMHNNLGTALHRKGLFKEALVQYDKSFHINPNYLKALINKGKVLRDMDRLEQSVMVFEKVLQVDPKDVGTLYNLGLVFTMQKKYDEAVRYYLEALRIQPDHAESYLNLAHVYRQQGKTEAAIEQCHKALAVEPENVNLLNTMAWILAATPDEGVRNAAEAIRYAEKACELSGYELAGVVDTLAVAYAAAGRFEEAVAMGEKAVAIADSSQRKELAEDIKSHVILFRNGKMYVESEKTD